MPFECRYCNPATSSLPNSCAGARQGIAATLRPRASVYPDGRFWQALVLRDEVEQVAADAVLEDEPDVVLRLVPVEELEHERAVELVQELHFVQDLRV